MSEQPPPDDAKRERILPPIRLMDEKPPKPAREHRSLLARPWIRTILGLVLAWLIFAAGVLAWRALHPHPLKAAAEECKTTLNLADDGRTLLLYTMGNDKAQTPQLTQLATMDQVSCVLDATEAPTSVRAHLTSTRALDGQQTDSWDKVSARWGYHPDVGLRLVLTER